MGTGDINQCFLTFEFDTRAKHIHILPHDGTSATIPYLKLNVEIISQRELNWTYFCRHFVNLLWDRAGVIRWLYIAHKFRSLFLTLF